ncbi:MAG: hypothetical protein ACYDCC_16355 [Actinomycetota bacterium]
MAFTLLSVQLLGQVALGFEISIALILISILTCALLEIVITFARSKAIAWPASAMLTGNGIALILRTNGTAHGKWWSLHGAGIFLAVATVSLLSKYIIRLGGRQIFNPSNIGLVLAFLILGTGRINPQDLWWGAASWGLWLTYTVIVTGGLIVAARLDLIWVATAFWISFAASLGIVTLGGHCIRARWHIGPLCGQSFWWIVVSSPEILIFLFFMITDPKTMPKSNRALFAIFAGFASALLAAPQTTEFGTKVGVLAALAIATSIRPLFERISLRSIPSRVMPAFVTLCVAILAVESLGIAGLHARPKPVANVALIRLQSHLLVPLPPITLDRSLRSVTPPISASIARVIAADFINDLEQTQSGTYSFTHFTLALRRIPNVPQAPPGLTIFVEGTRNGFPLQSIYLLENQDGAYRIAQKLK